MLHGLVSGWLDNSEVAVLTFRFLELLAHGERARNNALLRQAHLVLAVLDLRLVEEADEVLS